jgi:hypothetical protein
VLVVHIARTTSSFILAVVPRVSTLFVAVARPKEELIQSNLNIVVETNMHATTRLAHHIKTGKSHPL